MRGVVVVVVVVVVVRWGVVAWSPIPAHSATYVTYVTYLCQALDERGPQPPLPTSSLQEPSPSQLATTGEQNTTATRDDHGTITIIQYIGTYRPRMDAENAGTTRSFFSTAGTASRSERSGVKTERRRHAHGPSIPSIVVAIVAAVLWWAASPSQSPSPTSADRAKLRKIKGAMRASWNAYTSCAAPYDEVLPLSCAGQEWLSLALTATDSLDTLLMMGLDEE